MSDTYEIDISRANTLIAQWGHIAQSIARQCQWRARGQCLFGCEGIAVCNLEGLQFVNSQGRPVSRPLTPDP